MSQGRKYQPKRFNLPSGKYSRRHKQTLDTGHSDETLTVPANEASSSGTSNVEITQTLPSSDKANVEQCSSKFNPNIEYKVETQKENPLKMNFSMKSSGNTDGSRIINLDNLAGYVGDITKHVLLCENFKTLPQSPIKLLGEVKRYGLHSVLAAECQGCFKIFNLQTSPKLPIKDSFRFDVNVRAVWGEMVTGGGVSHLNESLATIGVPGMTQTTFTSIEQEISDWWNVMLEKELLAAAAEEKRIAIEKGNFHENVPAITVICDGGWSKRSHKHSYNAAGGVAIIIGKETSKLLHIGVANKNCYICTAAESKHVTPTQHTCYKNWSESSQAMEADIIFKGFQKANEYGLRYIRMIGDGDSSVHSRIFKYLPVWGKAVVKVECANHCTKCLRSNLERLVADKPHYKGAKLLSQAQRIRLVTAVRCAIKMRSQEPVDSNRVEKLQHDIMNSVNHIFGHHTECSAEYCKVKQGIVELQKTNVDDNVLVADACDSELDHSPDITMSEQARYWTEGTSDADMEEVRGPSPLGTISLEKNMLKDVQDQLRKVSVKADRLIDNFTSNLAEAWMNIRAKFDGGKFYNRCNRGSWQARCFGGALRMNLGVE
jgi:hypothetical protein